MDSTSTDSDESDLHPSQKENQSDNTDKKRRLDENTATRFQANDTNRSSRTGPLQTRDDTYRANVPPANLSPPRQQQQSNIPSEYMNESPLFDGRRTSHTPPSPGAIMTAAASMMLTNHIVPISRRELQWQAVGVQRERDPNYQGQQIFRVASPGF